MADVKITDKDIVEALSKVPPLSSVVAKALKLIRQPTSSAERIAETIAKDPIISFEVMRIVNSPFYGFSRQVSSLEHAIALVGTRTLESILLSAFAKTVYSTELKTFRIKRGELSIQSFVGAYVAKNVASQFFPDVEDTAFTAAVLRSVGKIAMEYFLSKYFDRVKLEARRGGSFDKVEQKVFGFTSSTLSAMVLERWKIPEEIRIVVAHYGKPSEIKDKNSQVYGATVCVHIGDRIAMMTGLGAGLDSLFYEIDLDIFTHTKIKKDDIEKYFIKTIEIYPTLLNELREVML